MKRIVGPNDVATDLYGPGKDGLKSAARKPYPATIVTDDLLNDIQEEIASAIEGFGFTLQNVARQLIGAIKVAAVETAYLNHETRSPAGSFSDTFFSFAVSVTGLIVAVGSLGEIQTSPDGITWTKRAAAGGYAGDFRCVAYNGLFVAVGELGEIQTSPDGITWTRRSAGGGYNETFMAVVPIGGAWIAAGAQGEIQVSGADGAVWAKVLQAGGYTGTFHGLAHIPGVVTVAVGSSGEIQTSPNGTEWTKRTQAGSYSGSFLGVAANPSGFGVAVAFVAVGTSGEIQTSINGLTWVKRYPGGGFAGPLNNVCARPLFTPNEDPFFVAVGDGGEIHLSAEGYDWRRLTRPSRLGADLFGVRYFLETVILGGESGSLRQTLVTGASPGSGTGVPGPGPGPGPGPDPDPDPPPAGVLLLLEGRTLPADFPTPAGMLNGPWQVVWTPDWSSSEADTRPLYNGLFVFNEDSAGNTDALEIRCEGGIVYLETSTVAGGNELSTPFTFTAGQPLTITGNPVTGRVTLAGALSGNGTFTGEAPPWWASSTSVRVGGYRNESGATFVGPSGGTFGNVITIEEEEEPQVPASPGLLQPGVIYWGTCGHRDQGGPYASISIDGQVTDLQNIFGSAPNTILYRAFGDGQSLQAIASDVAAFQARGIIPVVTVITYPPWSSFANEAAAYTYGYNTVRAVCQAAPSIDVYEIGNEWNLQQPIFSQQSASGLSGTLDTHWRQLASYPLMRGAHAGAIAAIRDFGKPFAQVIGGPTSGWIKLGFVKALADDLVNYNGRNLIWDFTCCHWYNGTSTGGNRFGIPDNFDGGLNIYQLLFPNNPAARKTIIFSEFGSDTGGNASSNAEASAKITEQMSNFKAHQNGSGNSLGVSGGIQFELYNTGTFPGYLLYNYSGGTNRSIAPQGTAMRNWILANPSAASGGGSAPSGSWVGVDDESASITYTGSWYIHGEGFHESLSALSEASFTFVGTGIRYFAKTASYLSGSIEVYVDNVLQTTVSNTQPGENNSVMLYEKTTGLSNGSHTIRVRLASGNVINVGKFEFRTP